MKSIALVITIAAIALSGCKKDDKGGTTTPADEKIRFWVVNMDSSESFRVFGGLMTDTVLLQKGEKTKVYSSSAPLYYSLFWVKQSLVDTAYRGNTIKTPVEATIFLRSKPNTSRSYLVKQYNSTCFTPPDGMALVRVCDLLGLGNRADIISAANDTTNIREGNWVDSLQAYAVPCNSINPGKYTINLFSTAVVGLPMLTKTNVELENGQVYFIYGDYGNTIRVLKR